MHAFSASTSDQPRNFSGGIQYELLWRKDFLEISHSSEGNFLKLVWSGLPGKENIMEGSEKILEIVKQFSCTKVINDVSRVQGLFTEAVDWVITNFAPRLNANGVTYVAWIYSENSISRYSADAVVSRSITDTIAIVFDNLDNAERWMLSL